MTKITTTLIFESVLYTWIYNNTNRSILAAILFHFMANAFGQLFAIPPAPRLIARRCR